MLGVWRHVHKLSKMPRRGRLCQTAATLHRLSRHEQTAVLCSRLQSTASAPAEQGTEHAVVEEEEDILPTRARFGRDRRSMDSGPSRFDRRRRTGITPQTSAQTYGFIDGSQEGEMAEQLLDAKRPFDNKIFDVDQLVRRNSRIPEHLLQDTLQQIQKDTVISPQEAALLLRSAGSYVQEVPAIRRMQYVEKVWDTLPKHGVSLDISYYNLLLSLYLENRHKFSVPEFLEKLKAADVTPNRVTYQRLIAHHCVSGDMDGASKILAQMKSEEMPVNEYVFNALIFGHLISGEDEKGQELLELMKKSTPTISTDTYCTMLRAYAERGDTAKMDELFAKLDAEGVEIGDDQMHRIILSLVYGDQPDHVKKMLDRVRKERGYYRTSTNLCLRLLSLGAVEPAYAVLQSMGGGGVEEPGHFFLRAMVRRDIPPETIINICDRMKADELHGSPLESVMPMAFHADYVHSEQLLDKYLETVEEPRNALFWPLFVKYGKARDLAGIEKVLAKMASVVCPTIFDTWARWIFPFVHDILPLKEAVQMGQRHGISPVDVVLPYLSWCLEAGKSAEIADALTLYPDLQYDKGVNYMKPCFTAALFSDAEVGPVVKLMKKVVQCCGVRGGDSAGNTLSDVPSSNKRDAASGLVDAVVRDVFWLRVDRDRLKKILQLMALTGLSVTHGTAEDIRLRHVEKVDNEIGVLLFEITDTESVEEHKGEGPEKMRITRDKEITWLKAEWDKMVEGSQRWNGRTVRRLLMLYIMEEDLENADLLLKSAAGQVDLDTAMMLNARMMFHSRKGEADKAFQLYTQLRRDNPDFAVMDMYIVRLAAALVKAGKTEQAKTLLNQHRDSGNTPGEGDVMATYDLVDAACQNDDIDCAQELAEMVIDLDYSSARNRVFAPIMNYHLQKEDLHNSIEYFLSVANKYKRSPMKEKVYELCLKLNSKTGLQKLYDQCSDCFGEMNTMADLGMVLIDQGQTEQARKLLSSEYFMTPQLKVDFFCEQAVVRGNAKRLETWLDLEKRLLPKDKMHIYGSLLEIYRKNNDYKSALNAWSKMEEEDLWPATPEIQQLLAKILEENGQKVPFDVPKEKSSLDKSKDAELGRATPDNAEVKRLLEIGELDEAFRLIQDESKRFSSLSYELVIDQLMKAKRLDDASKFLQRLLENGKVERKWLIKSVIQKLADEGNVSELETFSSLMRNNVDLRAVTRIDRLMIEAKVNSGNVDEIMRERSVKDLAAADILYILEKHPEFESKFRKEASGLTEKNEADRVMSVLWASCMSRGDVSEADKILAEYPQAHNNVRLVELCVKAKAMETDAVLRRLLEVNKNSDVLKKGVIYSYLVGFSMKNNLDKACEWVREAESVGVSVGYLKRPILLALKMELNKEGRTVPFEVSKGRRQDMMRRKTPNEEDFVFAEKRVT